MARWRCVTNVDWSVWRGQRRLVGCRRADCSAIRIHEQHAGTRRTARCVAHAPAIRRHAALHGGTRHHRATRRHCVAVGLHHHGRSARHGRGRHCAARRRTWLWSRRDHGARTGAWRRRQSAQHPAAHATHYIATHFRRKLSFVDVVDRLFAESCMLRSRCVLMYKILTFCLSPLYSPTVGYH